MIRKVLSIAKFVIVFEYRLWKSLFRWLLRRPAVPRGAQACKYAGAVTPVLIAFIVVSAIEIPILHLILPDSWKTIQISALIIGIQGLLWMIGFLASLRVHPHVLDDAGLRIRNGSAVDIPIPWDAVDTIRHRYRPLPDKQARIEHTDAGLVAHVDMSMQTNVDIVLRQPRTIPFPKAKGQPVVELRCFADDPEALVAAAREHITATKTAMP